MIYPALSPASVPIGVGAPNLLHVDLRSTADDLDLTTVTAASLDVLDAVGGRATWTATIPGTTPTWAASTAYAAPTSGAAASISAAGGVNTLTGMTAMIPAVVGLLVTVSGSSTPANNGAFPIASELSASSVTYADAGGATDASGAVHWSVAASSVVPPSANGFYYQCTSTVPATWAAATKYAAEAVVSPPTPTGYVYQCLVGGETAATPPVWPTTLGQAVSDGAAVWRCAAAVGQSAANAPEWPTAVGETVADGALVWKCAGPATTARALRVTHAFASSDVLLVGPYQVRANLTVAGGSVPVRACPLIATGIFGGAI